MSTEYVDAQHGPWQELIVPILCQMPRAVLAQQTGLSVRSIAALRNGHARPHQQHQQTLARAAADFPREQLRAMGQPVPSDDLAACAAYLRKTTPDGLQPMQGDKEASAK